MLQMGTGVTKVTPLQFKRRGCRKGEAQYVLVFLGFGVRKSIWHVTLKPIFQGETPCNVTILYKL